MTKRKRAKVALREPDSQWYADSLAYDAHHAWLDGRTRRARDLRRAADNMLRRLRNEAGRRAARQYAGVDASD